jgi:hypothetical protein
MKKIAYREMDFFVRFDPIQDNPHEFQLLVLRKPEQPAPSLLSRLHAALLSRREKKIKKKSEFS